jgi:ABC-type multidrug transport system ATPase subunit
MKSHFIITFPLVLQDNSSFNIVFTLQQGSMLKFNNGLYYLAGDNGSGKTSFLNMLSLLTGRIGKKAKNLNGGIKFNGEAYHGKDFNYIRAAEIREKSFCIFPQRVFFLPISTRDNYMVLNGTEQKIADSFSSREYPDLLSGGQQQKTLMDIVLDFQKPVWFLDEPLSNLDVERRNYFWKTLNRAYKKELSIVFFIDHWMTKEIREDKNFRHYNTLHVSIENRQKNSSTTKEVKHIDIYENSTPREFFIAQMQKVNKEKVSEKNSNQLH